MVFDFARLARQPRLFAMRVTIVTLLTVIALASVPSFSRFSPGDPAGADLASTVGVVILLAAFFLTPAIMAGAISSEREKGTLELLIVAGAKPRSVLFGKFLSHAASALLLTIVGLPIAFASGFLGGVDSDRIPILAANAAVVAFFTASLSLMATANSAGALPAMFSAFGKLLLFSVGSFILAGWIYAFLLAPWIPRTIIVGVFCLAILFVWVRPSALIVRIGCLGVMVVIGGILFMGMVAMSGSMRRYLAIPAAWDWILSAVSPWLRFYEDATGETVSWPHRAVAWGSHLALSSCFLWRAARHFVLEPPDSALGLAPVAQSAYARFLLRQSLREKLRASPTSDPPPTPRSSIDPHAAASVNRRNALSSLPVGRDPIYWKETAWRRIPDLERAIRPACGFGILFLALSLLPAGDTGRWEGFHWPVFLQILMTALFATVLAAALVASERESGTLPLLLSTGFEPMRILAGKARALCYWMWPLLLLLALHVTLISFDLGERGIWVAMLAFAIVLDAGALGMVASAVAPTFRTAALLGVVLLAGILVGPPILNELLHHSNAVRDFDSLNQIGWLLEDRALRNDHVSYGLEILGASTGLCFLATFLSRSFLARTVRA